MQGLEYETVNLGPPKPPCNQDRLATLRALECTEGPPNPELGMVTLRPSLCFHERHPGSLQTSRGYNHNRLATILHLHDNSGICIYICKVRS